MLEAWNPVSAGVPGVRQSAMRPAMFFLFSVLLILFSFTAHGAFEFRPVGARAAGTGDAWMGMAVGAEGAFWNPAAVAWGRRTNAFAGYDRPFGLKDLETQAASAVICMGRHGVGITYQGYGFALYREQAFGFAYGLRVAQRAGVGVSVRVLQATAAGRPVRHWTVFDLGLRVRVGKGVYAGASAWNAGGTRVAVLGQGGAVGLGVAAAPGVVVLVDVRKEAGLPTGLGVGLAWRAAGPLTLRVGVGRRPERLAAGVGLRRGFLSVDYAAVWHTVLGVSHRVSLTIGR